jgi:hypothetical protein
VKSKWTAIPLPIGTSLLVPAGIGLTLPSQASFNLDARTSAGSLKINRALTAEGFASRNHLQSKVGNGGALLDAYTASGNIDIN